MVWRTRRRSDTAEHVLTSAIVARVTGEKGSATAAEVAVRGALARAELDRTIDRIAVVAVGNAPFARVLGAALGRDRNVKVVPLDEARALDADGAFLVLPDSTPSREAKSARDRVGRKLLGVVLAADATPPVRDADGDRLAQLTHREAALRKVTDAVEQERARIEQRERGLEGRERELEERGRKLEERGRQLDERERGLKERERGLEERERGLEEREQAVEEASAAHDGGLEDRAGALDARERELERREREVETAAAASAARGRELAAALERAETAERELSDRDEQVVALQAELEAAEQPEPEPPREPEPEEEPAPPGALGVHNLRDLEDLVRDAQLRNDPRAEEMAYYVPLLREHASLDGRLPAQFDALVESVFG